ncbi:Hypothetical predicted protein [Pelobates cultripes]|uniref:Uncharacterized protein n=1 Tax=Pelobates cultripes TaxID=61616 RepID=A0AAD1VQU6_PELCU|nr:Hypothetical predicted protein [Pelobates cultripes]CAH2320963.1 Hypothetical predicted protein [Pelobates cultripes]
MAGQPETTMSQQIRSLEAILMVEKQKGSLTQLNHHLLTYKHVGFQAPAAKYSRDLLPSPSPSNTDNPADLHDTPAFQLPPREDRAEARHHTLGVHSPLSAHIMLDSLLTCHRFCRSGVG